MENRFKLARTQHNQHGSQSVKVVSSVTGITKSLIDDLESTVGKQRNVSYLKIKRLAEHYGVSSDYLLGLSPVPSLDEDIQAVCKVTGLSEKALNTLQNLHMAHTKGFVIRGYEVSYIGLLSKLLERPDDFYRLFDEIALFMVYGEVLPAQAYETQENELSIEEWERFHRWANGHKQELVSRDEARELHLQLAGEKLKAICREMLENETVKGGAKNGQH